VIDGGLLVMLTTVPRTRAPTGASSLPSVATSGVARLAEKASPAKLESVPTGRSSRTLVSRPAGAVQPASAGRSDANTVDVLGPDAPHPADGGRGDDQHDQRRSVSHERPLRRIRGARAGA